MNVPDPKVMREVVEFLREWIPESAAATYRQMIKADPRGWHTHPHFRDGFIVKHALRGNGITEKTLGVRSLEEIWPELVQQAVTRAEPDPVE